MECPIPMDAKQKASMDDIVAKTMKALARAKSEGKYFEITLQVDDDGNAHVATDSEEHSAIITDYTNGEVKPKVLCQHCKTLPCLSDTHYDLMVKLGKEVEDDPSNAEHGGWSNNTARFHIYSGLVREIYGHLGKGVRRQLPACVTAEVKDLYPAQKGTKYTGFKGVGEDVID